MTKDVGNHQVFLLDITMDELLVVSVLQGVGDLFDVGVGGGSGMLWDANDAGVARGLVHDEEGNVTLDVEVEYAHDMRVDEGGDGFCFMVQVLDVVGLGQLGVQDFDGCLHFEGAGAGQGRPRRSLHVPGGTAGGGCQVVGPDDRARKHSSPTHLMVLCIAGYVCRQV